MLHNGKIIYLNECIYIAAIFIISKFIETLKIGIGL